MLTFDGKADVKSVIWENAFDCDPFPRFNAPTD